MKVTIQLAAAILLIVAVGQPALAAGGEVNGVDLLKPTYGTVFWTAVTFVVLLFVMRKYAWGPLIGAIDAREQSIRDSFEQAAKDRDEAEKLIEEHRALIADARRERASAVEAGKRDAEKVRAQMLDEAKKQRDQVLADTQSQIDASVRTAQDELRATAVDLAVQAAGKLLTRNLDDPTQRRLVEEHLADLERSGDSSSLPS